MKLSLTEQMKHRIVGIGVILSLTSIFLPALMKKSNYRFDEVITVAAHLPKAPALPKITIPSKNEMFETIRAADIRVEPLPQRPAVQAIKAEALHEENTQQVVTEVESTIKPAVLQVATNQEVAANKDKFINIQQPSEQAILTSAQQSSKQIRIKTEIQAHAVAVRKKSPIQVEVKQPPQAQVASVHNAYKKGNYAVQLGTFSQPKNAVDLVKRLQNNGFEAQAIKLAANQGNMFKVVVGNVQNKAEAHRLQHQLATLIKIKGFVVKMGAA